MGTLTRGRLLLLSTIIAILGLAIAPAATATTTTTCAGDYPVALEAMLLNPNAGFSPGEATIALPTPIPAGDYTFEMISYDDHSHKLVDQSDQLNEQWYLQLLDAQGGVVFQSGVSPDLPDAQDWLTFPGEASVLGQAVAIRVAHAAIGDNVNSIVAFCVAFSARPAGSIGDTVWFDANGNGVQDGDEAGIPGIDVALSGATAGTTTTDANGGYTFTGLPAGDYTVTVGSAPAGTALTTDGAFAVALGAGEAFLDADFGFGPLAVETGSIGDTVWLDANENGWMDGDEAGLGGVTVLLTSPGTTGAATAVTDAGGHYLFADLPAASYDVTVDLTTGPANSGLTTAGAFSVVLDAGERFRDADFGFAQGAVLATASIGDQVWMDDNLNGLVDADEPVLAGVTVSLTGSGGATQTAVTGANGRYLFAALTAGTYEVSVVTATAPESTALTTAGKYTITLSDGQSSLIADFGFAQALPTTGFETADFGIAGLVLLLIGVAALALVRPGSKTPWHLVNAYEVR